MLLEGGKIASASAIRSVHAGGRDLSEAISKRNAGNGIGAFRLAREDGWL